MNDEKALTAELASKSILSSLPDIFPEKTLAELLGKSPVSLWRMRKKSPPEIPYLRISNAIYYLRSDVEAFLTRSRIS